jgi:hypothetical protein
LKQACCEANWSDQFLFAQLLRWVLLLSISGGCVVIQSSLLTHGMTESSTPTLEFLIDQPLEWVEMIGSA